MVWRILTRVALSVVGVGLVYWAARLLEQALGGRWPVRYMVGLGGTFMVAGGLWGRRGLAWQGAGWVAAGLAGAVALVWTGSAGWALGVCAVAVAAVVLAYWGAERHRKRKVVGTAPQDGLSAGQAGSAAEGQEGNKPAP